MLHGFHHHDGVVHYNADGQHEAKHRQRIDGETQRDEENESPDDGNRNGQQRNECGPPALQKQKYHQNHEKKRLDQCHEHFFDGHFHHRNGLERHHVVDIVGKGFFQLIHLIVHALRGFEAVAAGGLVHQQVAGPLTIHEGVVVVAESAQLHPRHVFEVHQRTVAGPRANDNITKFLRRRQAAVGKDRVLEGLVVVLRRRPHRTDGDLQILLLQGRNHLAGSDAQLRHFIGLQPNAHTEIVGATENVAHALHAQKGFFDVDISVVADEVHAVRLVGRVHRH